MKKLLLFTIFAILFKSSIFSQELEAPAQALKNKGSQTYQAIEEFSEEKWKDDYSMVLYEINKQSEAFFQAFELVKGNEEIFKRAVEKWGDGISPDQAIISKLDWTMILYEMEKQIKSRKAIKGNSLAGKGVLSDMSYAIKISQSEFFNSLYQFASKKHEDQESIQKEINAQVEAFTKSSSLVKRYKFAGSEAIKKSISRNSKGGSNENFTSNPTINWIAVYEDLKNELEPAPPKLKPRN